VTSTSLLANGAGICRGGWRRAHSAPGLGVGPFPQPDSADSKTRPGQFYAVVVLTASVGVKQLVKPRSCAIVSSDCAMGSASWRDTDVMLAELKKVQREPGVRGERPYWREILHDRREGASACSKKVPETSKKLRCEENGFGG